MSTPGATPRRVRLDFEEELNWAGGIRQEAKAVERRLPVIIFDARECGISAAEIARKLVCTEWYVHRITRTHVRQEWFVNVTDADDRTHGWGSSSVVPRGPEAEFVRTVAEEQLGRYLHDNRDAPEPRTITVTLWGNGLDADPSHEAGFRINDDGTLAR